MRAETIGQGGSYPGEQSWLTYEKTRQVRDPDPDPDLLQAVMDLLVEMAQSIEEYV